MLVVQEPAAVLALVGAFGLLTRVRGWPLTLLAVGLLAVVGRQVLASRPAGARQAELLDEEAPGEDPDGEG